VMMFMEVLNKKKSNRMGIGIQEMYYKTAESEGKTFNKTQKPVALMEYLIKTYTNENELVLDFTMGSGSCGVAAKNTNRNFTGIELDEVYFDIAKERILLNNTLPRQKNV
jgi:DNA modification methylase